MAAYRRATGRKIERGLAAGIIAVLAAVALVVMMAEAGSFQRFGRGGALGVSIPSLTVGDGGDDQMPVVTSVRSNGAAERAGIKVGDEIEAVNGRQVHNVAALRAVVSADRRNQPLALHIRRGDAVWTIAIDRSEQAADETGVTGAMNGAENPAD
jgi:S1-C subfamily serine protease